MNAEEIIDEIILKVDSDDVEDDREQVLKLINRAHGYLTNHILLPGLADGFATVSTVVDDYKVDMPDDYSRGLFLARTNVNGFEKDLTIVETLAEIVSVYPNLSFTADIGSVNIVAAQRNTLYYYMVPSTVTEIGLFYHRKPTPMEDVYTSYPDGLTETGVDDEAWNEALIYYACWKLFAKIEQGLEGKKIDTSYNANVFNDMVDQLELFSVRSGVSYKKARHNKVW